MSRKTRKLMWSVPLIAVVAVIGALAAFMTLQPNDAAAQDAAVNYQAGSPLNLMVTPGTGEAKRTSLVLNWEAPTTGSDLPITGYRIDQSADEGKRWTHLANVGAGVLTYTHSPLKPDTLRNYRVFALNRAGTGQVSEIKSAATVAIGSPGQVQNLNITATSADKVNLTWDPPADTGGTRLIGYLIHFSVVDGGTGNAKAHIGPATIPARGTDDVAGTSDGIIPVLASSTSYEHKGLLAGSVMSYKIYAVNWYDDDETSLMTKDPVEKRDVTTPAAMVPAAPKGLTVTPLLAARSGDPLTLPTNDPATPQNERATHVNLYWYWPETDGGDGVTSFRVEVSKDGRWPDDSVMAGTVAEANTALSGDANSAAITVTTAEAFGATRTDAFQLQHTDAATTFLTGAGKKLHYQIFAINSVGKSLPSTNGIQTVATYEMLEGTRSAPEPPSNPVWTDGATRRGATQILHYPEVNLSWDAPALGITATSYRVDLAEAKTIRTVAGGATGTPIVAWKMQEPDTRLADPTYDHRGWRPKTTPQTFNYRVFAKAGGLTGASSGPSAHIVDGQTAPGPLAESTLSAQVVSANQIDVSWDPPVNDGGTDIVGYCFLSTTETALAMPSTACTAEDAPTNIDREIIDAPTVGVLTESAPDTMFMDKSLNASTTYRYHVYALNKGQVTPASGDTENAALALPTSPSLTFQTSATSDDVNGKTSAAVKPAAPTMVTAEQAKDSNFVSNQDRGVLVMWNGPADPAGDKISGYEVQRKVDDGEFVLVAQWSNRTTHFTDQSEPKEDEIRQYRSRARNKLGWSPWSDAITVPLPEPTTPPPALTKPVLTAAPGTGSVTLTWDQQAAAVEYTVWGVRPDGSAVRAGSTDPLIRVNDVTGTSHEVTGLMSGQEYWFAVTACEMVDCGAGNYLHSNVAIATPD